MQDTSEGRWPEILLIYALGVFAAMAVSEAVPVLGDMAREFHPKSRATLGWVMSLPALVVALSALLVGWMVDRTGDRPILLIGGILVIGGDLGVVSSHSLQSALGWRILDGVGYVCMAVSAVTMLARVTRGRRRTTALALWSTFVPASFVVPFLAARAIAATGQWRWAFGGHAAVLAVLLVLGGLFLRGRSADDNVVSRTRGLGDALRSPWPYVLGLSFAANAFVQTGVVTTLAHWVSSRTGALEPHVQSFNVVGMLFNIVGSLLVGQLLNRGVAAARIGIAGIAICAVAGITLYLAPLTLSQSLATSWAFMFGSGLLLGMWTLLPAVAPSPASIGATSGLVTQITLLGVLFGPPASFIALGAGPNGMVVFVVAALVVSLVALPIWRKASLTGLAGPALH